MTAPLEDRTKGEAGRWKEKADLLLDSWSPPGVRVPRIQISKAIASALQSAHEEGVKQGLKDAGVVIGVDEANGVETTVQGYCDNKGVLHIVKEESRLTKTQGEGKP